MHYYLWWDAQHWRAKLGSAYPVRLPSPPVPANLDGAGCAATSSFPGNTLLDVPAPPLGLYSQDNPRTLNTHVDQAAGAGIDGFVVSWSGNGDPTQHPSSSPFDRRLDLLVRAVHKHNARTGDHFSLIIGYQGLDNSRVPRPLAHVANDLDYFTRTYASDPAFHVAAYGSKPVVMLLDSRKFTVPDLAALLTTRRASLTLIGDEHGRAEWLRGVAPLFDGAPPPPHPPPLSSPPQPLSFPPDPRPPPAPRNGNPDGLHPSPVPAPPGGGATVVSG